MNIQSVVSAQKLMVQSLRKGAEWIAKSHPAVIYALDLSVAEQDLSPINALYSTVKETSPVMLGRFVDYVVASLDGVTRSGDGFTDGGESFQWSECASKATAWNTHKRLAQQPKAAKPVDPRKGITQLANSVARAGLADKYATKAQRAAVAEILARAKADLEAVVAGTYGAPAQHVDPAAGESNVSSIAKRKVA